MAYTKATPERIKQIQKMQRELDDQRKQLDIDYDLKVKARIIPIDQLVVDAEYKGEGRNFSIAKWNGEGFVGMRYKFGETFEFMELHYDSDPHYGTFIPLKRVY